jgi:hypothetical protein
MALVRVVPSSLRKRFRMNELLKRTAKIKIGSSIFHERYSAPWIPENVDERSSIDAIFTIKPTSNGAFDLSGPYYGITERDAEGKSQYGSGSLTASSIESLELLPWEHITEDQTREVMLEIYPQFYIPSFELKRGILTNLTANINAAINPLEVMSRFQVGRRTRVVVCAANRITHDSFEGGSIIICSARHYQGDVRKIYRELGAGPGGHRGVKPSDTEQGFIDQWEEFMTREEAFKVATIAKQPIDMNRNHSETELYSEGRY